MSETIVLTRTHCPECGCGCECYIYVAWGEIDPSSEYAGTAAQFFSLREFSLGDTVYVPAGKRTAEGLYIIYGICNPADDGLDCVNDCDEVIEMLRSEGYWRD